MATLPATAVSQPLRIEIGKAGGPTFKSLDHIVWEDIPPFAVLTGVNGSGKTQLLEFLSYRLAGVPHPEMHDIGNVFFKIDGDSFGPDSVVYISNRWEIGRFPTLSLANLQQTRQQLWTEVTQNHTDFEGRLRQARLCRALGFQPTPNMNPEAFAQRLSDDFEFMLDEVNVGNGLAYVFLGHRLRAAEEREKGKPEAEIQKKLGPAPWEVVNQAFSAAGFPFRVPSPMDSRLLEPYRLVLEDTATGRRLAPTDLSSGEKTLLALVLWLYNAQHHGRFPKLFLLDEPDAHLHPSFTRHLLDVMAEVLVGRYQVRVILTTHSPSTVALAPEGSLFEMRRDQPRIVRSVAKAQTVGLLTAGLVTVSPGTRHVLVEDDDDVEFFCMLRDVLTDYGPTRDPCAMKPVPTVMFLPASLGKGKTKISGGKSVVLQWLEKLDTPPLSEIFRGAIDRDSDNSPGDRLVVLNRYSIENYYVDPLVVYGVLLDQGAAPSIAGLDVPQGQEHLIRSLPPERLQAIVDTVAGMVVSGLERPRTEREAVKFTNGIELQYPMWMLHYRGHDLLPIYQQVFGGPGILSLARLSRAFRRVRMIPSDLAHLMATLQS